jgi:diacylglycerol kinase (ATP)
MSLPTQHIALVCNPTKENEKALKVADQIVVALKERNILFSLFTTYWPTAWEPFTEAWIIGGDGTVNHFINQYPDIQLPLAVFAAGSGNDLHWMLYGDTTVEKQLEKVLLTKPTRIDAGLCNNRLFLNGVGIGFDGAIVKDLLGKKKLAGKASYLLSILKQIFTYKEKFCEVQFKNELIVQDCFMISVANAQRYGGGFRVAPKALVTDGLLDVSIIGKIAPPGRIRYLPVMEKGEHLELPFVTYRQADQVVIRAKTDLPAHIDGEWYSANFFKILCLPGRFLFLL